MRIQPRRKGAARASRCSPPCRDEAACRRFSNGSALCVCVHDSSPAVEGRRCPRVPVPVSFQDPIPVVVLTSRTSAPTDDTSPYQAPGVVPPTPAATPWAAGGLQASAAASLLLAALLLGAAAGCLWRRRHLASAGPPARGPDSVASASAPAHCCARRFEQGAGECLLHVEPNHFTRRKSFHTASALLVERDDSRFLQSRE